MRSARLPPRAPPAPRTAWCPGLEIGMSARTLARTVSGERLGRGHSPLRRVDWEGTLGWGILLGLDRI